MIFLTIMKQKIADNLLENLEKIYPLIHNNHGMNKLPTRMTNF